MPLLHLKEEDLHLVLDWRNDESIRKNMYSKHIITYDEHLCWFKNISEDESSSWLLFYDANNVKRGLIYFTKYDKYSRNAFLGLYSAPGSPPGVGAKIEFEALDHAFGVLDIHKLNCEVLDSNDAALRMHLKFGFRKEGVFRDFHFDGTAYHDVVRLGMLFYEWKHSKISFEKFIYRIKAY